MKRVSICRSTQPAVQTAGSQELHLPISSQMADHWPIQTTLLRPGPSCEPAGRSPHRHLPSARSRVLPIRSRRRRSLPRPRLLPSRRRLPPRCWPAAQAGTVQIGSPSRGLGFVQPLSRVSPGGIATLPAGACGLSGRSVGIGSCANASSSSSSPNLS